MGQLWTAFKMFGLIIVCCMGAIIGMFVGMVIVPLKILDGSIFKSANVSSTSSTNDPSNTDQI